MEKIGSINKSVTKNVALINKGRKLLHTKGKTEQGRTLFVTGISGSLQTFKDAQTSNEPNTIIQVEQFFLKEELKHADKKDNFLLGSLNNAITELGDALKVLPTVETPTVYKNTDKAFLTSNTGTGKDRVGSLPKDAFHKACNSHKTRLISNLRTPGLSDTEKEFIKQRAVNLDTAKKAYMEKQRLALGLPKNAKVRSNDRER